MSYILFFSGQDRIRTCMSSYLVVPKCVSYSKTTSLKKLLASTIPPPDHLKTDLKRRIILLIILRDGKRGSVFIFKELICSQDRIRTCITHNSWCELFNPLDEVINPLTNIDNPSLLTSTSTIPPPDLLLSNHSTECTGNLCYCFHSCE